MTLRTNARIAGYMFLLYIATGIASMILYGQATHGPGVAERLASMAQHAPLVRLTVLLTFLTFVYAVVLGVTLYALTREQDRDLAMIALCCRLSEGVIGAVSGVRTLGILSLATAGAAAAPSDASATNTLASTMFAMGGPYTLISASCFAVGSTLFSYLFLRARSIPVWLAWLGVLSSILLVVGLALQIADVLPDPLASYMWIPMAVFEVVLALWLILKGVATTARRQPLAS